jgi:hypothetical protein
MLSRLVYSLLVLSIAGACLTGCAQPPPTLTPASPSAAPSPESTIDAPAYKETDIIGIAGNQVEVKSLYAAAEATKDYKFPEVKDFKWSAQYIGSGRWYVTLAYTQWDYNANGYIARTKGWFFEEANGTLSPAG